MAELSEAEGGWRTLMVTSVTLSYPLGQIGFDFGAYGELSFSHMLVAWICVTATLIIFSVLPKQFMPMPRWHILFLTIPSFWMLGRFVLGISSPGVLVHPVIFAVGIASYVFCFPYAIYLIVRVANPDLADIRGFRLWSILTVIAGVIFALAFFMGSWNEIYVSCQDARIGRIELPEYCLSNTNGRGL